MKLLLTSSGIANPSIGAALVQLLGKPIAESKALFVPTGMYPFFGGGDFAWQAVSGKSKNKFVDLGWKTMGLFELSVLPSIPRDVWVRTLQETDVLLVYGGDVLFLRDWMRKSGVADVLPTLRKSFVYVGVSAGSMVASSIFTETYSQPPLDESDVLAVEEMTFDTPEGPIHRRLTSARGLGLVEFAIIPHLDGVQHPDAALPNAEKWAAKSPVATYALDDASALKVVDGKVEVVSEGKWKLFPR